MSSNRLISVDAFRGLTIAGMILVNNPGSWSYVYAPLLHAEWNGWTPTDLIFPFFLFIVGISIALSFSRRRAEGRPAGSLYAKIFRRSAAIFALGLFLHLFPRFRFATMRIPGVLQRIAVCFLVGALIYLSAGFKSRLGIALALLAGSWALMKLVPVPGLGAGGLAPHANLAGWLDVKLLGGHIYKPDFDPEGILSTIPAIATVLLGTLAGDWLRSARTNASKLVGLAVSGGALTGLGLLLHPLYPINKQLWTSTYVVFTAGLALLVFAAGFWLIEMCGARRWAAPFLVFGTNAIAVFAGSTLMVKILMMIKWTDGGTVVNPMGWLYRHALAPLAGPYLGSLLFPLLFLLLWLFLILPLYRRKIFIRL